MQAWVTCNIVDPLPSEILSIFIIICRRAQPPSAFWQQGSETPSIRWLNKSIFPQRTQKTLNFCGASLPNYGRRQPLKAFVLMMPGYFSAKDAKDAKMFVAGGLNCKRSLAAELRVVFLTPVDRKRPLINAEEITPAQWLHIGVFSSRKPPYLASLASFAEK